jgi:hypothetical protein
MSETLFQIKKEFFGLHFETNKRVFLDFQITIVNCSFNKIFC